jgi:RecB family exonuclease
VEGDEAVRWAYEVDLLLGERARTVPGPDDTQDVTVPAQLSVSHLVALRHDPQALARTLRRPMPRRPDPYARRGTAFHRWLEQRFGADHLLDLDELPGAGDENAAADSELAALQQRFLASQWAQRTPVAVEVPFATVIDGVVIRGRMDAVFADAPSDPVATITTAASGSQPADGLPPASILHAAPGVGSAPDGLGPVAAAGQPADDLQPEPIVDAVPGVESAPDGLGPVAAAGQPADGLQPASNADAAPGVESAPDGLGPVAAAGQPADGLQPEPIVDAAPGVESAPDGLESVAAAGQSADGLQPGSAAVRGGWFDVVDWKTGRRPTGRAADEAAIQLGAYRLAWAELAGVPVERVRAAFHYVRDGVTVRPVDLIDAAGLVALIASLPAPPT